jgi:hypothetical protein
MKTAAVVAGILLCGLASAQDDPWADAIIAYAPLSASGAFVTPGNALGVPMGGGATAPNNGSIVSLGVAGGSITLAFATPVADDPLNPLGLDCIVFSNSLWAGGNPQAKWQEPAFIEISEDVNDNGLADDPWYLIPGSRELSYAQTVLHEPDGLDNSGDPLLLAGTVTNPNLLDSLPGNDGEEYNWGYAEMTPTAQPYLDNYTRPDDPSTVGLTPRSGGGDAFDIAWAVDASDNPADLTQFHFIRLTTLVDRSMFALGAASAEIEAVADVAADVDTDGDGIRDEYETRVAGTDPLRPESTVLPLEIPSLEGGSPFGMTLGMAEDERGTRLRLIAGEKRTALPRAFNVSVDLLAAAASDASLPDSGYFRSGTAREIVADVQDFVAVGIQAAEITLTYTAGEIAGLAEEQLTPYRYTAGAYTREGISEGTVNAAANQVVFLSRYPGIFVLASVPGAGDVGSAGPQGAIALMATPAGGLAVDAAASVAIETSLIYDDTSALVADATPFTVALTAGTVAGPDAAPEIPGHQVAAGGGRCAFEIASPTRAGTVTVSIQSVTGSAFGQLLYTFAPGAPAHIAGFHTTDREKTTGIRVEVELGPLQDLFGNTIDRSESLTVTADAAVPATMDADSLAPGHQVRFEGGYAVLVVETAADAQQFTLDFHRATDGAFVARRIFEPIDFQELPAAGAAGLSALAVAIAWAAARRGRRR